MADLSIITLNVNGLRAQRKRLLLFDFLKRSKFDIVLLQETHVSAVSDCVLWNRESGFKGYWSLGTSSSCGVGFWCVILHALKTVVFVAMTGVE